MAAPNDCGCTVSSTSLWQAQRTANSEVRIKSAGVNGSYSLRLAGSNAQSDLSQSLKPGETRHKSVAVDADARLGALIHTELHANVTQIERDPGDSLRN